ncbi:hypothetical protein JCM33774_55780 [Actinophytocola sp. KF-1]
MSGGRPPSFVLAVTELVDRLWNGGRDTPFSQVGAVSAGGVGPVSQHPVRGGPRSTATGAGHPDPRDHGPELGTVTPLSRGHHQRQRFLSLLGGQVGLGGEPAPRPAQRVIVGFGVNPARWLVLQIPLFLAPAAC